MYFVWATWQVGLVLDSCERNTFARSITVAHMNNNIGALNTYLYRVLAWTLFIWCNVLFSGPCLRLACVRAVRTVGATQQPRKAQRREPTHHDISALHICLYRCCVMRFGVVQLWPTLCGPPNFFGTGQKGPLQTRWAGGWARYEMVGQSHGSLTSHAFVARIRY